MNNQLRLPRRQLFTAISELSEQITSEQQASSLIIKESTYQVIPGYLQSYIHQTDNILKWLLPHSKSRIVDITLPFTYYNKNLQQTRILGRYILFDRKLLGIRISSGSKDLSQLPKTISPSPLLQRYYKENKISFSPNQIVIGDFYLQLNSYRIGLFFQDELINYSSFKSTYEKYRFDIVSVMSNIQKKVDKDYQTFRINQQQKEIQYRLKTLSKQSKITVLFAGVKIVPNLRIVYWEKSFIIQDTDCIIRPKSLIGEKTFIALMANIQLSLQKKCQTGKMNQDIQSIENQKYLEKLQINVNFRKNEVLPALPTHNLLNKKVLGDFLNEKQLIVYNLWYLYKTVNKGSPFVIPFPFSNKRQKLFSYLIALGQHSNKDISQLAKVYRYKVDSSVSKYQLKIYDNFQEMLAINEQAFSDLIYVYCEQPDQLKKLKNSHYYSNRICNCQSLIPVTTNEVIQIESNEAIINKRIENACSYVLKERFQNIEQILAYFLDIQLNKKEIQKCFSQILPNKVKKFFKLTPHYLFFLQSTPQQMINEIGEAEIRLKQRGKSRIIIDQNDSTKNLEQFPKKFVERIQATRKYKNNTNLLPKCHRCDFRLKKDLLYSCSKCSTLLCYDCMDVLTNHSLFNLTQYDCLICLRQCKCNKCEKVVPVEKIPEQPIKQTLRDTLFNQKELECGKCEIFDPQYDKIRIECTQCKKMKCYNCAKAEKTFQISKMNSWICKECEQFNEEFMNKEKEDNPIEIEADYYEMNQQIVEESVSNSISPREVDQAGKTLQKNNAHNNINQQTLKESQNNDKDKGDKDLKSQKFKQVESQVIDKKIVQQSKNDKYNKNGDTEPKWNHKYNRYKEKERSRQRSRSRSKSRYEQNNRSKSRHTSREKKKRRNSSDSSSDSRSKHRKNQDEKKNKLWDNPKKKKEDHKKDEKSKNIYIKKQNNHTNQSQERNFNKKNQSSLWGKEKNYKQVENKKISQKQSEIPFNKVAPFKINGLIFQTNTKKEIDDSQQQSY